MKYAPIMIPTCNRVKHLKRCLESLSNNKLAKETDVYISVDYPPSEKYREGYERVLDYLKNFNKRLFKKLVIFQQEKNLGARDNALFLFDYLEKEYDRFIFTEDDNEFSKNFLEYMNIGLVIAESDNGIFTVCGFKSNQNIYRNTKIEAGTVYRACYTQPYGYGCLFKAFTNFLTHKDIILNKDNYKYKNIRRLIKRDPYIANLYISNILCRKNPNFFEKDGSLSSIDGVMQLYSYYADLYSLFPTVNKSRTWGNDGTGTTMGRDDTINPEKDWPLDELSDFQFFECTKDNFYYEHQRAIKYFNRTNIRLIFRMHIKLLIFYLCRCNSSTAQKIVSKF